ncbi:MAG: patatin family protein, partial [Clostridia bacterium]|nr:patatin family protein [Clostridia bacterium]
DCETGKPVYFNKTECKDDIMQAFMASSSLPFISKIVDYKGHKLLDGGISDSIPVRKALEDGNEKIVVVLTRDAEYVKEQFRHKILAALRYRKYPELVKAIINRYKMYNETTKYIKELEKQGKALVIRPTSSLNVSRFERNMNELAKLYELGYKEAKECGDEVRAFVKS